MVRKGLKERQLRFENQYLRKQLDEKYGFNNIIGTGRAMKRIFELVDTIAGLNSTVLIQGETGTGKELIAKAIHFNSPRKIKSWSVLIAGRSRKTFSNPNYSAT